MVVVPHIALLLIKLSHLAGISQDAPKIMLIVFLAVITPSASTVTQMCQVYGNDSKYASAINVFTTLSAIVSMPVMVFLFEYVILKIIVFSKGLASDSPLVINIILPLQPLQLLLHQHFF